jgi:hypothetical protein
MKFSGTIHALTVVLSLTAAANLFAQGSLTPPGAPAPTMKSLAQVEPRIPISSLPITISSAGSYYFTTNLFSTNGITIAADNVTLDLCGFTLAGLPGGVGTGISSPTPTIGLRVFNGAIRSWTNAAINTAAARDAAFSGLSIYSNGLFAVTAGANCQVRNCTISQNGGGISLSQGSIISDCIIRNNTGVGIVAGESASVLNCTVYNNGGHGISLLNASSVEGCVIKTNLQNGIVGIDNNRITRCNISQNVSNGVSLNIGGQVSDCVVSSNKVDGIRVVARSTLTGNVCDFNGTSGTQAGIHLVSSDNRVDENNLTSNIVGVRSDLGFNVIVRNKATLNSTAFSLAVSDVAGPTSTNAATAGPWANFAY